ncbi:hypothetical protein ZOSMA_107G00420 [Zostera marina]|uniref:UVR domain-containing protein n=1 Tax=Zostera marina TaxID=29655 RepID=A0A0K9Q5Y9_ZOSMR|nr:hypothetical protein ZOSMA_107G00420 [Zostera marina]
MASPPDDTTFTSAPDGDSLFEGMVFFDLSSSSSPLSLLSTQSHLDEPLPQLQPPPSPTLSSSSTTTTVTNYPLDEDIFSDLTVNTPDPDIRNTPPTPSPVRQIPRKKKRTAVRVGYAREIPPVSMNGSLGGIRESRIHLSSGSFKTGGTISDASHSSPIGPRSQFSKIHEDQLNQGGSNGEDDKDPLAVLVGKLDEPRVVEGEAVVVKTISRVDTPPVEPSSMDSFSIVVPSTMVSSSIAVPSTMVSSSIAGPSNVDSSSIAESFTVDSSSSILEPSATNSSSVVESFTVDSSIVDPQSVDSSSIVDPPSVDSFSIEKAGEEDMEKEDAFALAERKLEGIRSEVANKLQRIRDKALSVLAERKKFGMKRRKITENVNSALVKYKELETELDVVCEAEDFIRAEMVSENLASVEREKDVCFDLLRRAEKDCDEVDMKMQEILEMQIKVEEEAMLLLEQFSKDTCDSANLVLKNVEVTSRKAIEEWQMSLETIELKKMETIIELHLMDETRSGIETSIGKLIQDDANERERLSRRHDTLTVELNELLVLVKLKETEIEANSHKMQEVEKKISYVVNNFDEAHTNIDKRHSELQASLSVIESEGTSLSLQKKNIDEHFTAVELTSSKLKELARVSMDEAATFNDQVELRQRLASPILKLREEKLRLATIEGKISKDVEELREKNSAARSSLQELSSNRSCIQEEDASSKQRIFFIDKRCPELESEKKVAASARNFKEAGRIAAEAKALNTERETIQKKRENAVSDLEEIEQKINTNLISIEESEILITVKEKEAARAKFELLHLTAANARAERFAALKLGDPDEGAVSFQEVEAAESKADELQQKYDFEKEKKVVEKTYKDHVSIALVTNLPLNVLSEIVDSNR